MAKQEMFQHPLGAKLFTALGGIPVERGSPSSRAALKATQAALEVGEPVALFPEGTRRHGREVTDLFDGTAYLAVKLGVPDRPGGHRRQRGDPRERQEAPAPAAGSRSSSGRRSSRRRARRRASAATSSRSPTELQVELQRLFDQAMRTAGYADPPAPHSFRGAFPSAVSSGGRDELVESFGGSIPSEGLAGSAVEEIGDVVEVGLGVD